MTPKRVLAMACDDFACGNWRIIQPYSAIADPRVRVKCVIGTTLPELPDVVVFQRVHWPQQIKLLRQIKGAGKRIIIDYDDAFPLTDPLLPEYSLYRPGSPNDQALKEALRLADAVTVPTPELREHYLRMHPRVVLLPNAVDPSGPLFSEGIGRRVSEKLTIFWSGWTSHERNLRMVVPAIHRLLSERDDVVLAICGPPELARIFGGPGLTGKVAHIQPVPFTILMRLAWLADIAIAPLELTQFNDAKSEIRLIEAGVWSVPAVASPAAPYRRFEGGRGACLLTEDNEAESWYGQIKRLVDDPTLRREVGQKARVTVESRYDLRAVNRDRVELLCDL